MYLIGESKTNEKVSETENRNGVVRSESSGRNVDSIGDGEGGGELMQ